LVKEVGTERAIVHKLAPHLVIPEKMILPLIEGGTYGEWLTSIGLKVYDVLASVEGDDKRKMLDKEEALKKEPLLPEKILNGAGYYAEYRTDDARLTIEVLKTATQYDAQILNYTQADEFIYENKRVAGIKAMDVFTDEKFDIKAKYVVNACGPWVDELRQKNHSKTDIPDGRMMFAIPRGKVTYFGTTDTNYQQDKNNIETSLVDATYLISAVNNMFPNINLTIEDIESSWAGLRPLIHEEGKSASELSRKDEIFVSDTELISIAGGKLTGYRKMSERIVDLVAKKYKNRFDKEFEEIQTENLILTGGPFLNYKAVKLYIKQIYKQIKPEGLTKKNAQYLVHNYGKQTDIVLDKFDEISEENPEKRLLKAEVWFTIQHEMTYTPTDFFMRRTGRLFFDKPSVDTYKEFVLNEFSTYLKLDVKAIQQHKDELNSKIDLAIKFE